MTVQTSPQYTPPTGMALVDAVDMNKQLDVAAQDLEQLQQLLQDAGGALQTHFHGAAAEMKQMLRAAARYPEADASRLHAAMNHLASAITALQFQDIASQLVSHTGQRLRHCTARLEAGRSARGRARGPAAHEGLAPLHGTRRPPDAGDTRPDYLG